MSLHYLIQGDKVLVRGHTYPHKEKLKALGAAFDREKKVWVLSHTTLNIETLDAWIQNLGPSSLTPVPKIMTLSTETILIESQTIKAEAPTDDLEAPGDSPPPKTRNISKRSRPVLLGENC